ncbi:MAG: DUF4386 domain-containing protein [Chloroflexota bacterium]
MVTSPTTRTITNTAHSSSNTTIYRITGILLLAQFAIFLIPVIVLGNAINWPASLGEPASVVLPLITEQSGAVRFGYFSYMISSFLVIPISFLLYRIFREYAPTLIGISAAMGLISGVMKILGIVRWLVVMPVIAAIYLEPSASAATRDAAAVAFTAFNEYAGGVGELLGVAFFSGLWTILVAIAILRTGVLPRWTGWFGLVAALAVIYPFASIFGIEMGTIILVGSVTLWQFWMIATGTVLLFVRPPQYTS